MDEQLTRATVFDFSRPLMVASGGLPTAFEDNIQAPSSSRTASIFTTMAWLPKILLPHKPRVFHRSRIDTDFIGTVQQARICSIVERPPHVSGMAAPPPLALYLNPLGRRDRRLG